MSIDSHPEMLANRIGKRSRHLRRWARRNAITCYRLYDRDIPEIPLIVDVYGDALHIATRFRPEEEERAEQTDWLEALLDALCAGLAVPPSRLYLKQRVRQKGLRQYGRFGAESALRIVEEGGLRFEVNLSDYLDTGLFLDHRRLRARAGALAEGRTVLNLFAYTGAFSIHAAAGGAREVFSVDLSNTYLQWAERNAALNDQGAVHRWVRADVRQWLADQRPACADLIVLDPPTFSNSARMEGVLDIQRDHVSLVRDALRLLRPGGILWFSTNHRGFRPDPALEGTLGAEEITASTIDEDFRQARPHRCWELRQS